MSKLIRTFKGTAKTLGAIFGGMAVLIGLMVAGIYAITKIGMAIPIATIVVIGFGFSWFINYKLDREDDDK